MCVAKCTCLSDFWLFFYQFLYLLLCWKLLLVKLVTTVVFYKIVFATVTKTMILHTFPAIFNVYYCYIKYFLIMDWICITFLWGTRFFQSLNPVVPVCNPDFLWMAVNIICDGILTILVTFQFEVLLESLSVNLIENRQYDTWFLPIRYHLLIKTNKETHSPIKGKSSNKKQWY